MPTAKLPRQNFRTLVRHLERHVNDRGGIYRLSITQRGFETNLVRSGDGGFIEPMAKTADDFVDLQRAVRRETYFEQNLTFELQVARFLRVNRIGLEGDFDRSCCRAGLGQDFWSLALGNLLGSEAAG